VKELKKNINNMFIVNNKQLYKEPVIMMRIEIIEKIWQFSVLIGCITQMYDNLIHWPQGSMSETLAYK